MATAKAEWQARPAPRARTPTVLQMEAVECGAAAPGIVLAHFGRFVPLADLRRACGVSRDGSKASNILKAARAYGLQAEGYKKELSDLAGIPPPYIVFWHFDHFLVVEGFARDRVFLNDPETGPRVCSLTEFDENFTGVVLRFVPGEPFSRGGERPGVRAMIQSRLGASAAALGYCIAAGLIAVPLSLAAPLLSQVFVDQVLVNQVRDFMTPLLLGMLVAGLLQVFLSGVQLQFLRRLRTKLAVVGAGRFLWHCLRLPVSYYAQRSPAEVST
ncbi:MAG: NHLP family bacteriocin export ABC transporter peptidase/permease/ATPase, partial [Candidatus Sericytochromatia bacterium]|nr:NHLP family bacteriocin export ABC transporter peptidase/permease/ATPase [Candidatus Tanganyikabacteria bacterium]